MTKSGKNKAVKEKRRFALTFSLSGLLGLGASLAVLLTLFFVLGLLVGRGYRPESMLPPLAEFMPEENRTEAAPALKPEELDYLERLTTEQPKASAPARRAKPKPKPVIEKAVQQARAEAAKTSPAPDTPPAPKAEAGIASGASPGAFNYVYQVAAFREQAMAEELKGKITGLGLGCGLEQADSGGAVWYRVMVRFQGSPDQTRNMRAKLATLGIDRIIMRSKQPATP